MSKRKSSTVGKATSIYTKYCDPDLFDYDVGGALERVTDEVVFQDFFDIGTTLETIPECYRAGYAAWLKKQDQSK